jgi:hypothetical protein
MVLLPSARRTRLRPTSVRVIRGLGFPFPHSPYWWARHRARSSMRPYVQGALRRRGFPPRNRPVCRHCCRPSYLVWALRPRPAPEIAVIVRAVLENPFPPDGHSPCPAGSLACCADPELPHPPAGRYSRQRGGSRAAHGQDAMTCPGRPSPAAGARNPSPRALGDCSPGRALAAPAARARVSARTRASLSQQPAWRAVLHYAPAPPIQRMRGAPRAAGGPDGQGQAPRSSGVHVPGTLSARTRSFPADQPAYRAPP